MGFFRLNKEISSPIPSCGQDDSSSISHAEQGEGHGLLLREERRPHLEDNIKPQKTIYDGHDELYETAMGAFPSAEVVIIHQPSTEVIDINWICEHHL